MLKFLSIATSLILLSACSMTASIQGVTQNENEVITGTATGYLFGNGKFKLISNAGFICEGIYDYPDGISKPAIGGYSCDNGSQGDMVATTVTGTSGYGLAQHNNKQYVQFTFGNVPGYKNMSWSIVEELYSRMSQQMRGHIYYCEEYPDTLKCKR
jgi:hypothetical protein